MTALIALSDCTVLKKLEGDVATVTVVTPATADSGDEIDVSTLVADGLLLDMTQWDVSSGSALTGASATYNTGNGIVVLDVGGGQTNQTYAVHLKYVGYTFTP